MDELKPLFLYSANKKVYVPVDEKDKRHNSAILLLTPSLESSSKLMKLPYIHNPNLFTSFYIDRNVKAYLAGADDSIDFDEKEEETVSESMVRNWNTKVSIQFDDNIALMDKKYSEVVFNRRQVLDFAKALKIIIPETIKIYIHPNIKTLRDTASQNIKSIYGDKLYSYSNKEEIHVLSKLVYDANRMGGPYDIYLKNELLINLMLQHNPDLPYITVIGIAQVVSGMHDWMKKADHDIGIDTANKFAVTIAKIVKQNNIKKVTEYLDSADIGILVKYITSSNMRSLKKLIFESTLSYSERQRLLPSEFGIPDKRKYPMPDVDHVKEAIRMFNHCDPSDEEELAESIIKKIKKFNITDVKVSAANRFRPYFDRAKADGKVLIKESFVNESIVINQKDIQLNFNSWKKEKGNNILYVIGMSGSGKTTLAEKYEKEYGAQMFELDGLEYNYDSSKSDILNKVKKEYPEYKEFVDRDKSNYDNNAIAKIIKKACDIAIRIMHNMPDTLFIVEGVQLYEMFEPSRFAKKPIILKNTSIITSLIRRINRNNNENSSKEDMVNLLKYYWSENKRYKSFKKGLNESFANTDYYDILTICNHLSSDEFKRISFYDTYRDSNFVIKRIIKYSGVQPVGFLDVYQYPSKPDIAQIVIAVDDRFRGQHVADDMVKELLACGLDKTHNFKMYYWTAHPHNYASKNLAMKNGFIYTGCVDKYGREVYIKTVQEDETAITTNDIPGYKDMNSEDDPIVTENTFVTKDLALLTEAEDPTYSNKLRKYLYAERLKNNKEVFDYYDKVKALNPEIKKMYIKLSMYKRLNLFVDLSYYHALFLQHNTYTLDRAVKFYFDFLNRLINNKEIDAEYPRKTIFIPVDSGVWPIEPGTELYDYKKNLNPISMFFRLMRTNLAELKREWGDKNIIFVGSRGYFTIDFNTVDLKSLPRIKSNINKLMSMQEPIVDDYEIDSINDDSNDTSKNNSDTPKARAMKMIDTIEKGTEIKIDNVTTDKPKRGETMKHLSITTGPVSLNKGDGPISDGNEGNIAVITIDPDGPNGFDRLSKTILANVGKISSYCLLK